MANTICFINRVILSLARILGGANGPKICCVMYFMNYSLIYSKDHCKLLISGCKSFNSQNMFKT